MLKGNLKQPEAFWELVRHNPTLRKVFTWLEKKGSFSLGEELIIDATRGIKGTVKEILTEAPVQRYYEEHKLQADLHFLIAGKEKIRARLTREGLLKHQSYNEKEDYLLYRNGNHTGADAIIMRENDFLLLMPGEPHMPGLIADEKNPRIIKAVLKIPATLLKPLRAV